jgi:hypothetical protein
MTIKVPDSWNEITIRQFMELSQLDRDSKDYSLNASSILLEKDPEEIRRYDPNSMAKIIRHLEWAMKYPDEKTYNQVIEIEGKEYFLIENINHFTGGQWWDMEEYLGKYNENIHNIFAMLYTDEKEYDSDKCKERGEFFLDNVMIGQVYGALVFFSIVEKESMIRIPIFLIPQTQKKHQKKGKKG